MKVESSVFSKLWHRHVGSVVDLDCGKTGEIRVLEEIIAQTRQETGRFIYLIAIDEKRSQIHGHYDLSN